MPHPQLSNQHIQAATFDTRHLDLLSTLRKYFIYHNRRLTYIPESYAWAKKVTARLCEERPIH